MLKILRKQDGQTIALVAVALATLVGFSGLVINYGTLATNKAQVQAAADAGALAGAQNLVPGANYNQADAQLNAVAYARMKPGKTGDIIPTPVIVPLSGFGSEITVKIRRTVETFVGNYDVSATATARVTIAGGVPQAPPFVVARKSLMVLDTNGDGAMDDIDYSQTYTMRKYDANNPHKKYEFDYANTVFKAGTDSNTYLNLVENGWDKIATTDTNLYYYGPSSGSPSAVDRYWERCYYDNGQPRPNNVNNPAIGDTRLMIIPVVEELPPRSTSKDSTNGLKIKGFVGFYLTDVKKNNYYETYRAYGKFVKVNVPGAVETNTGYYMGLSAIALVK